MMNQTVTIRKCTMIKSPVITTFTSHNIVELGVLRNSNI